MKNVIHGFAIAVIIIIAITREWELGFVHVAITATIAILSLEVAWCQLKNLSAIKKKEKEIDAEWHHELELDREFDARNPR